MDSILLNTPLFGSGWKVLQETSSGEEYPRLILTGKFQEAMAPNNNRRKYRLQTLQEKIITARCTPEKLQAEALLGENIHPNDKLTGEINSEKVIWKILEAKMEGNVMKGAVEIIPELPLGKAMYFLIEKYNAVPGISSRGFGAMDGDWVDHDSYKFVTFDGTFNPSTHGAFLKKIGTTNEMKEFIKSFQGKDIQCLSESSMLRLDTGQSLVENIFNTKSYHILNEKKDMSKELELLQEANAQVANLSVNLSKSQTALAESKKSMKEMEDELMAKNAEIKEMKDKMADYEDKMEKSKKESEESEEEKEKLEESVKDLTAKNETLEENYGKALKVAEGMTEKYHEVNGFYNKSIQVLELMESTSEVKAVNSLVESELGAEAVEEFRSIFEGKSLEEATTLVGSLKKIQSGNPTSGPAKRVPLQERVTVDKDGNPISESVTTPEHDEARISAYGL